MRTWNENRRQESSQCVNRQETKYKSPNSSSLKNAHINKRSLKLINSITATKLYQKNGD